MDSGLKLWGIITATVIVVSNGCPTLVKAAARLAKIVFGARIQFCSGAADDVELNAALLFVHTLGGGRVIMIGPAFAISATVSAGDNTILEGQGDGTVWTLDASVNDTVLSNINSTPGTRHGTGNFNITVRNFKVDGNKANQGAGADTIWCVGFSTVENLRIEDMTVINGWTGAIRTEFCTYVWITDNRVDNSGDDAIGINEETYHCNVKGNVCSDWGKTRSYGAPYGIEVQDGSHDVTVSGNNLSQETISQANGGGISVCAHAGFDAPHDVTISNNTYKGLSGAVSCLGVAVEEGDTRPYSISVTGNTINILGGNNADVGIFFSNTDKSQAIGNDVKVNGYGLRVNDAADISFIGNTVDGYQAPSGCRYAVGLQSSSHIYFIGNQFATYYYNIFKEGANHDILFQGNHFIATVAASRYVWYENAAGALTAVRFIDNQYEDFLGFTYPAALANSIYYKDQHSDLFMDVLAVLATHVRSNQDLSLAIPLTFTIDAQPDVPRTLSGHFDSHAQITAYSITITGVDAKGNTLTETKTEADLWDWETDNAFATITSIIMTARTGTGAGDTMDIGVTDVLGLSNRIQLASDVYKIKKNTANAAVAGAQVNTTYDTYDMAVIGLAATDDFTIWFRSNLNIVS